MTIKSKMRFRILPFLFFFSTVLLSQVKPLQDVRKPIGSDCATAIPITISTNGQYGPTEAPKGFGNQQEIHKSSSKLFDQEHNSAWYLLNITRNGKLVFEINPKDTSNDYDFVLFRYTDSTTCENINKNLVKPLRANLSNLSHSNKGITGLRGSKKDSVIGKGPGEAFSNFISVKQGEKYVLILDNVTPKGEGHTLYFNFTKEVEINGKVTGPDSIPLVADVTLSDTKGNTVAAIKTNTKGEYSIKTAINENQNYNLTYVADNTFVEIATVNTKDLKKSNVFPDIKTVLPKLKKGSKYVLGNINFYPGEARLLPESYPSVEALGKLMKKNKKMQIEINGHTNGQDWKNAKPDLVEKVLSEQRAETVFDYLIKIGIARERMTSIGWGSLYPISRETGDENYAKKNRRVEIKVVSIE